MEQLLITLSDIAGFRPISDKIDDSRIGPYILEAQECDLKPILNDAFYYYICKNINETEVQELIYGKEYEYESTEYYFNGISPVLSYYTLARFIQGNPLNINSFGNTVKTNPHSTPADTAMIQAEVRAMRSAAIRHQEDLITFLTRNKADYPLWSEKGRSDNKGNRNAFNFWRA